MDPKKFAADKISQAKELAKTGVQSGATPQKSGGAYKAIPRKTQFIEADRWNRLFTYYFSINPSFEDGSTDRFEIFGSEREKNNLNFSMVRLRIPPQAINVTTQFANAVSATNRGVLEESNGVVFRTITISGTTGVYPDRESFFNPNPPSGSKASAVIDAVFPGAKAALGNLLSAANRAGQQFGDILSLKNGSQPLKADEIQDPTLTGHYQFWVLHNFFVEYAEAKKGRPDLRLVFHSPKDNVGYVCTPVQFDLRRDSGNPLQYKYNIVLRCWDLTTPYTLEDPKFRQYLPFRRQPLTVRSFLEAIRRTRQTIQAASGVLKGVQSDIGEILNGVNQSVLALKDVVALEAELMDFFPTIKANAELMAKSNKLQWGQILQERGQVGLLGSLFLDDGKDFNPINRALAVATGGGLQPDGSSIIQFKTGQSSTGETATAEGSSAAAVQTINKILDTPEIANTISMSELSPLPQSVQEQVDRQLQRSQSLNSGDVRDLAERLKEVNDNLAYNVGMMDETYAKTFGLPTPGPASREPNEDDILLTAQIEEGRTAYYATLATGTLYSQLKDDPFADANTVLSPDEVLRTPISAFPVFVNRGETLDQISLRTLGDANRSKEISILNDLRAPYIDEAGFEIPIRLAAGRTFVVNDRSRLVMGQSIKINGVGIGTTRRRILNIEDIGGGAYRITTDGAANLDGYDPSKLPKLQARLPGTVGSGDTLLIPSEDTPDQIENVRPTALWQRLSYAEQVFKIDIALNENRDLAFSANGDVARSLGYQNAIQSLVTIVETERGELEQHPTYGLETAVGDTFTGETIDLLTSRIRASILNDARFRDAEISVVRDGTAARIRIEVQGPVGTGRIAVEFDPAA